MTRISRIEEAVLSSPFTLESAGGLCENQSFDFQPFRPEIEWCVCLNRGFSRMTRISRIEEAVLSSPFTLESAGGLCENQSFDFQPFRPEIEWCVCLNRGFSRMTRISRIEEAVLLPPSTFESVIGLCKNQSFNL